MEINRKSIEIDESPSKSIEIYGNPLEIHGNP